MSCDPSAPIGNNTSPVVVVVPSNTLDMRDAAAISAGRKAIFFAIISGLAFIATIVMAAEGYDLSARSWLHLPFWMGVVTAIVAYRYFMQWKSERHLADLERELNESNEKAREEIIKDARAQLERLNQEIRAAEKNLHQEQAATGASVEERTRALEQLSKLRSEFESQKARLTAEMHREILSQPIPKPLGTSADYFVDPIFLTRKDAEEGEKPMVVTEKLLLERWGKEKSELSIEENPRGKSLKVDLSAEERSLLVQWTSSGSISRYSVKELFQLLTAARKLSIENLLQDCYGEIRRKLGVDCEKVEAAKAILEALYGQGAQESHPAGMMLQVLTEQNRLIHNPSEVLPAILAYWRSGSMDKTDPMAKMYLDVFAFHAAVNGTIPFKNCSADQIVQLKRIFSAKGEDTDYLVALGYLHLVLGEKNDATAVIVKAYTQAEPDPKVKTAMARLLLDMMGDVEGSRVRGSAEAKRARALLEGAYSLGYAPAECIYLNNYSKLVDTVFWQTLPDLADRYKKVAEKGGVVGAHYGCGTAMHQYYKSFSERDQLRNNKLAEGTRHMEEAVARGFDEGSWHNWY